MAWPFATIASTATFFLFAIAGSIAVFELFPEPDVSELDALQQEHKLQHGDPSVATIASEYSAHRRDQNRMRWKVVRVFALAFASAYLVSKRLKPND
jgi:predicted RNA-binding protein with PUA-like domain